MRLIPYHHLRRCDVPTKLLNEGLLDRKRDPLAPLRCAACGNITKVPDPDEAAHPLDMFERGTVVSCRACLEMRLDGSAWDRSVVAGFTAATRMAG